MKVAFLGAGTMGAPMVRHLAAAGHAVRVYNRRPAAAQALAGDNCVPADSAAAAAESAEAVLACVSDDDASRAVWFGREGALATAPAGGLAIELSTLSLAYVDEWAERAAAAGMRAVDAPVTGSRAGAEAGTLTAFFGCAPADVEAALAVLAAFCEDHFTFGPAGSGMRFKLAYNAIGASIGATLAEGLTALERLGLSQAECVAAFERTGWGAPAARSKGKAMLEGSYLPASFKLSLMHKDLRYFRRAADGAGATIPIARLVCDLYEAVVDAGGGDLDFSAVKSRVYEDQA